MEEGSAMRVRTGTPSHSNLGRVGPQATAYSQKLDAIAIETRSRLVLPSGSRRRVVRRVAVPALRRCLIVPWWVTGDAVQPIHMADWRTAYRDRGRATD